MRVGIIGGGPAGLYLAKYLSKYNHSVTVFEKEAGIGGMYRYAQLPDSKLYTFKEIFTSKNIKLIDNCEINKENFKDIETKFDAFVLATGGIPIRHNFESKKILYATDVIKRYMNSVGMKEPSIDSVKGLRSTEKDIDTAQQETRLTKEEIDTAEKEINKAQQEINTTITNNPSSRSDNTMKIGKDVLIIGMGNVSMDLIRLLFGNYKTGVENIHVVSRSSLDDAKFTNAVLRDVVELDNLKIDLVERQETLSTLKSMFTCLYKKLCGYFVRKGKGNVKEGVENVNDNNIISNRIRDRRRSLLTNLPIKPSSRSLRLIFNTKVESVKEQGDSFRVKFQNGLKKTYDTVISSMGFTSNLLGLNTNKPVFTIGWCHKPRGNISDALIQAKLLSLDINDFLKSSAHEKSTNEDVKDR